MAFGFGNTAARGPMNNQANKGGQNAGGNSGGSSNSGGNSGDNQNQNNQGNKGTNDQNNNSNDEALVNTIWEQVKSGGDGKGGDGKDQQNQNNNSGGGNNQQAPDAQTRIDNYLKSQGLDPISLTEQEVEAFKAGNYSINDILGKLNGKIAQAHLKAVSAANELITTKVADAVEKAVGRANAHYEGDKLRNDMYAAIPFTKDPAIAPVAETVLQRFMQKGATKEQAFKATKAYFDKVADSVNNARNNPNSQTRGRNFAGSEAGDTDWLSLLGPENKNAA